MATRYPSSKFIRARNFTHGPGLNLPVKRIVIHDMEMAEKSSTAEACAAMFAGPSSPRASVHFMVDSDSVVQGVELDRIAWHAPPNTGSVGIEHAGFAGQRRAQWLDVYGVAMLERSTALCAWLCAVLGVPDNWLTPAALRAGGRGLCTHADVSAAWHETDHTDPGPGFPKDYYLKRVRAHLSGSARTPGGTMSETQPSLTEIKQGVLFYPLDKVHVNPLTLLQRTYDLVSAQTGVLQALQEAEAGEVVDVTALAAAIVAGLPEIVVHQVDQAALAKAVADQLAERLRA
jgi:N-acetyl-anhydromuramyl-L-alanine amidase AmpD